MLIDKNKYEEIVKQLQDKKATLVAVSKTKSVEAIRELYDLGHRDFSENYVQEMKDKKEQLPSDIRWHFIGHLQTNKVKYIASFVHLVHGIDSLRLLAEVNRQAEKNNRILPVLLQVHIAREETKFGLDDAELDILVNEIMSSGQFLNVEVAGLMGMASFSSDTTLVRNEFSHLRSLFDKYAGISHPQVNIRILSMGMSADYSIALEEGSTMVRIGSLIFGDRS